ncbi:berberine bridge enzyme-like 14 [Setaria italica]|uniref:berberine bridge enzyme-like 14 n=1 Tax=Setaria italica TaxID=4555 RepID=UPI000648CEBF|nr:berberine bridge enzyme-like 14 [Setaria italica]
MASHPGVTFHESIKDFLADPIELCFGSMPVDCNSTATFASSASVESASTEQGLHPRIMAPIVQQSNQIQSDDPPDPPSFRTRRMASHPGVIFHESIKDFLADPIELCFGSMPVDCNSTATFASSASVESASTEQGLHPRIMAPIVQQGLSYASVDPQEHFTVLDLGELRAIHIDASRAEAWVGSGATLSELYYAAAVANQTFGFPAGNCPTVGGGGFGALSRKYGLSADNVLDAVMVDAEGRLLNRSTMGKDLFWAIRGGGWRRFCV